jgi:hypothetical protein
MGVVLAGVNRTYRPTSLLALGVAGLVLVVGLSIWVAVDEMNHAHPLIAVAALLWGLVIGELIAEAFLRPRVTTTAEGVELVNPFRTVVVPWEEIRGVDTDLALQIVVDGGRHTSFAATGNRRASAKARGLIGRRSDVPGQPSLEQLVKAGRITPPVECKLLIDTGMAAWREGRARPSSEAGEVSAHPVRVTWHRGTIVALVVSVLVLVVVTVALMTGS